MPAFNCEYILRANGWNFGCQNWKWKFLHSILWLRGVKVSEEWKECLVLLGLVDKSGQSTMRKMYFCTWDCVISMSHIPAHVGSCLLYQNLKRFAVDLNCCLHSSWLGIHSQDTQWTKKKRCVSFMNLPCSMTPKMAWSSFYLIFAIPWSVQRNNFISLESTLRIKLVGIKCNSYHL